MDLISIIVLFITCLVGIGFLGLIAYWYIKVVKFLIETIKQIHNVTK
jgi:hypothetical protein